MGKTDEGKGKTDWPVRADVARVKYGDGAEAAAEKRRFDKFKVAQVWLWSFGRTKSFVEFQTINAIETGKYDPSLSLAFHIAKLFAMSIEDVFLPDEVERASK